jgi:hypothetical protein
LGVFDKSFLDEFYFWIVIRSDCCDIKYREFV